MSSVTFESFDKDLDSIPNVIGEDSPAKSKAKPKATPKAKNNNKECPVTIRFTADQLEQIVSAIGNPHIALRPTLRDVILKHYGISK